MTISYALLLGLAPPPAAPVKKPAKPQPYEKSDLQRAKIEHRHGAVLSILREQEYTMPELCRELMLSRDTAGKTLKALHNKRLIECRSEREGPTLRTYWFAREA